MRLLSDSRRRPCFGRPRRPEQTLHATCRAFADRSGQPGLQRVHVHARALDTTFRCRRERKSVPRLYELSRDVRWPLSGASLLDRRPRPYAVWASWRPNRSRLGSRGRYRRRNHARGRRRERGGKRTGDGGSQRVSGMRCELPTPRTCARVLGCDCCVCVDHAVATAPGLMAGWGDAPRPHAAC